MKLFAFATAISAKSFKQTNFPAPGIINEQGGYWADQQSNQQQSAGFVQPGQIDFRKIQCCQDLKWFPKDTQNVTVWLHYGGIHRQMPYYKGERDGKTIYAWMNYQGSDDYWLGNVKNAHWILSSELGVYGDSSPENHMTSDYGGVSFEKYGIESKPRCLDQATQSVWRQTFVCADPRWGSPGRPDRPDGPDRIHTVQKPKDVITCSFASSKNQLSRGIFWRQNVYRTCNISQLMWQSGKSLLDQAIFNLPSSDSRILDSAFSAMVQAWVQLTQIPACGFIGSKNKQAGFIDRCEWICPTLRNIEGYNVDGIAPMLEMFLSLTNEYFARNHVRNIGVGEDSIYQIKDTQCGKHVQDIYRAVAKFEPYLEPTLGENPIRRLDSYDQSWRE